LSYDTLKLEPGKQRIDVVDITLEGCGEVYGVAPCTATSSENLLTYSETFAGLTDEYANLSIAVVNPGSYPSLATQAARIESDTVSIDFYELSTPQVFNVGHASFSCSFLKDQITSVILLAGDLYAVFDLSAGTFSGATPGTTATITSDGGLWYKCTISGDITTAGQVIISLGAGIGVGDGLWATKLQLIQQSAASGDYVKTTSVARHMSGADKCFNSWATCQDTANYLPEDKVISFCTPVSDIPDGCIPLLDRVRGDAGQLDPENSLGKCGQITVVVTDAPHDDTGIDPYVDERAYSALERGTFWPRFRARFPYYQGRKLEWYQGYYPFTRANAKKRTYIVEDLRGWGRSGKITIVAKDPLKLADDKRAQWPRASTGLLTAAMTDVASPTTIDITTSNTTEYDLEDYETVGVVLIGSECIQYTGVTVITDGVRLTGVSRGPIGKYSTVQAAHNIGAAVQKCAYFNAMKVPKVFQILLERGGNVPSSYIDYPTWEAEYDTWLGGMTVTRLICKPEGVTAIIKELIPQSNTWALWWDNESASIKYQVVRPLDYDEVIETLTDDNHIIAGSLAVQDDDSRLMNQVLVQYGQIDPTKDAKEGTNYEFGFVAIDVGSQSAREHGQVFSNTINGRWHPSTNRTELIGIADRLLQARSDVPVKVEFEVDRKDDAVKTAQFISLETAAICDVFGLPQTTIVRVIQQDAGDDTVKYVARQELLATGFARWAPDSIAAGTTYNAATDDEKRRYLFWADDTTGLLGGSANGKKWL
jgi:hypothetical protein